MRGREIRGPVDRPHSTSEPPARDARVVSASERRIPAPATPEIRGRRARGSAAGVGRPEPGRAPSSVRRAPPSRSPSERPPRRRRQRRTPRSAARSRRWPSAAGRASQRSPFQDLYLMANLCDVAWMLVGQAAQGIRDTRAVSAGWWPSHPDPVPHDAWVRDAVAAALCFMAVPPDQQCRPNRRLGVGVHGRAGLSWLRG